MTKDELEGVYLKISLEWVWNSLPHLYLLLINILTLLKENLVVLILHILIFGNIF